MGLPRAGKFAHVLESLDCAEVFGGEAVHERMLSPLPGP